MEDQPMRWKIGIAVACATCGREKLPHGRSAPPEMYRCNDECPGYNLDPKPGCLWPGETSIEFGYDCCDNAIEWVDYDGTDALGWEGGFADNH